MKIGNVRTKLKCSPKKLISLVFIFILGINSFAAVVSDNDGSAFITKAEFDSLKNNFQAQIDSYNTSLDAKIDGAIASYLSGIKINNKQVLKNIWEENQGQGFTGGAATFIAKPTEAFKQPFFVCSSYGGYAFGYLGVLFNNNTDHKTLKACWSWCTNQGTNRSDSCQDVPFWQYTMVDGQKYLNGLCYYDTQVGGSNNIRADLTGTNLTSGTNILFECYMDWTYMPDMKCMEGAIRYKYWYGNGSTVKDGIVGPLYAKYIPVKKSMITDCKNCFFVDGLDASDNKYPIITDSGELTMTGFEKPDTFQSNPVAYIYSYGDSSATYTAIRNTSGNLRDYARMSRWLDDDYKNLSEFKNDLLRRIGYPNNHCFTGAPIITNVGKGVIKLKLKSTNAVNVMFRSDPFPESGTQQSNIQVYTDESMSTPTSTVSISAGATVPVWIKNENTDFNLWLKPSAATSLSAVGDIILEVES